MSSSRTRRPSAVERYAAMFDREAPDREPTDAALREVLSGCARPVPHRLLETVRRAVLAYRQTPERVARDAAERAGAGAGESGGAA